MNSKANASSIDGPGHRSASGQSTVAGEQARELQQLYGRIDDPLRRQQALEVLRTLAPERPATSSREHTHPTASRSGSGGGCVLLVDDDSDVLISVGGFLEAEGIDVVRADCGQAALDVLLQGMPVDAVVTDYLMPGMSGLELLAAARRLRPSLPAVIITGYAALGEVPGNVAVIRKPFRRKQFIANVTALLEAGRHGLRS